MFLTRFLSMKPSPNIKQIFSWMFNELVYYSVYLDLFGTPMFSYEKFVFTQFNLSSGSL